MRDLRLHDTFCSQDFQVRRTVSEHALIDLIGFISIFFFFKELRPSLIATYPHESYERKNVHIMLFFSLHKTL